MSNYLSLATAFLCLASLALAVLVFDLAGAPDYSLPEKNAPQPKWAEIFAGKEQHKKLVHLAGLPAEREPLPQTAYALLLASLEQSIGPYSMKRVQVDNFVRVQRRRCGGLIYSRSS